jgi:hypothetical protein
MQRRGRLKSYRYRTPSDNEIHVFYAPTVVLADKYAKRWAKKQGYKRIVRLRRRR